MRPSPGHLAALALLVLIGLPPTREAAARRTSRTSFRDKTAGIQIFMPGEWVRQIRSAFPGVLATFKHPRLKARFVLAVRRRKLSETAPELARKNAAVLKARKWKVGEPSSTRLGKLLAVQVVAADVKGATLVRQIYAVRGEFAYVLSLVAPVEVGARLEKDFLFVLKSTRFSR
ncbi:MAG: hypothetical protein ABI333_18850 [bacterium]